MGIDQADLEALVFQQDLALHAHHSFQAGYNKQLQDKAYRNRFVQTKKAFEACIWYTSDLVVHYCCSFLQGSGEVNGKNI